MASFYQILKSIYHSIYQHMVEPVQGNWSLNIYKQIDAQ